MTSMVSLALKTVGVIMILSGLLDIITFLIPFNPPAPSPNQQYEWFIAVATQVIDRGIIPLLGVVLLLTGYWVDGTATTPAVGDKSWQDLRFWASLIASLLGLLFLLLAFLHPNNVRLNYTQKIAQITQDAAQAETQANSQLGAEVDRQRGQISRLVAASDDQLRQAVQAGAITQEQLDQVKQFKQNPASIDSLLKQQADQARKDFQNRIGTQKQQAQATAKSSSLKSGLRVGLSSLLLAIGFSTVGWTGLRTLGQNPSNRRPEQ